MIKAKELVNKSNGIDKYFFLIGDQEVKVGDIITCNYAGDEHAPVFEIYSDAKHENTPLYDLGKCFMGVKPNANTIAEFVDRCKLKIESIRYYHGNITFRGTTEEMDVMYVVVAK